MNCQYCKYKEKTPFEAPCRYCPVIMEGNIFLTNFVRERKEDESGIQN